MKNEIDIIQKPINQLDAAASFITGCEAMNFKNLNEIILIKPSELVKKSGFSYGWLGELCSLLQKNDLLHLLQQTPGSEKS